MHVGCYSTTLRWDRFGRRWVEPPLPPDHPPPFTSLNIHPLGVLHPFVHLFPTPVKYPQFVSNSLVISFFLSLSLSLPLSFFPLVNPLPYYPPPTLNIAACRVAFLLAGQKSRFLVTLTHRISDLLFTYCRISDCRRCLLRDLNFCCSWRFV